MVQGAEARKELQQKHLQHPSMSLLPLDSYVEGMIKYHAIIQCFKLQFLTKKETIEPILLTILNNLLVFLSVFFVLLY